jgi:hypothetical protein
VNESLYETSLGGRMPVNRFLRFFGAKSSSKETAVLSFAYECKLDVFLIRSPAGFEPQRHLKEVYQQAKELHVPVLIVLKNIDILFRKDKESSGSENNKAALNTYALADELQQIRDSHWKALNTYALAEELQQIRDSHWKIWTIILTTSREPLFFEVDQFFQNSTHWAGIEEIRDIFDDVTRGTIIMDCLRKYIAPGAPLPFDGNPAAVLGFANQFTGNCTYRQIDEFVRMIVNRWKFQVPPGEMLLVGQTDVRLVPTTKDLIDAVRGKHTISPYPPEANIVSFLSPN